MARSLTVHEKALSRPSGPRNHHWRNELRAVEGLRRRRKINSPKIDIEISHPQIPKLTISPISPLRGPEGREAALAWTDQFRAAKMSASKPRAALAGRCLYAHLAFAIGLDFEALIGQLRRPPTGTVQRDRKGSVGV
jgi:hypothetical protein